jgi:NAD+ kinase
MAAATVGLVGDTDGRVRSHLSSPAIGLAAVREADPDIVVAVGERGLTALAAEGTPAPVLPVGDIPGVATVTAGDVAAAVAAAREGRCDRLAAPVLVASVHDEVVARALFDLFLVTDQPAHISEYRITHDAVTVSDVRADGVVVATPAGSHGYARAAGGTRLAPATDALAVVPVSPFATADERWVLPTAPLAVTVERDACDITLVADDAAVTTLTPQVTVHITPAETLPLLVAPMAPSPFASP